MGDGLRFMSEPLTQPTEITGPSAAKLWVSSTTEDADLFLILQVFDPEGQEITFQGALDPHTPIAHGWLRASHRKLDTALSRNWRPYHTHDQQQPLTPGETYQLEVELWPTSIVVPAGYTVALWVRGHDYTYQGNDQTTTTHLASFKNQFTGVGPFLHNDPRDRPPDIYTGHTTLHLGPAQKAHLLLPLVPPS